MCITLCFVCVFCEKWKFLLFLLHLKVRQTAPGEFSKHFKASKSFPITFSHAGFKIIVHNPLHYTSASGWELIRSLIAFPPPFALLFLSPSGPHWGVSEEDWGQRGSHLHQQRHSLLHGSPHPHPSTSSFFFAGMLKASSVKICVWDLCNQNSCYSSHCLQIVALLISFIKLKAVMYFPLKSTRSSPSFLSLSSGGPGLCPDCGRGPCNWIWLHVRMGVLGSPCVGFLCARAEQRLVLSVWEVWKATDCLVYVCMCVCVCSHTNTERTRGELWLL